MEKSKIKNYRLKVILLWPLCVLERIILIPFTGVIPTTPEGVLISKTIENRLLQRLLLFAIIAVAGIIVNFVIELFKH